MLRFFGTARCVLTVTRFYCLHMTFRARDDPSGCILKLFLLFTFSFLPFGVLPFSTDYFLGPPWPMMRFGSNA